MSSPSQTCYSSQHNSSVVVNTSSDDSDHEDTVRRTRNFKKIQSFRVVKELAVDINHEMGGHLR